MYSETKEQLIERRNHVSRIIRQKTTQLKKMKFGAARSRTARFIGSLEFTLGQIESKMRDRHLMED